MLRSSKVHLKNNYWIKVRGVWSSTFDRNRAKQERLDIFNDLKRELPLSLGEKKDSEVHWIEHVVTRDEKIAGIVNKYRELEQARFIDHTIN